MIHIGHGTPCPYGNMDGMSVLYCGKAKGRGGSQTLPTSSTFEIMTHPPKALHSTPCPIGINLSQIIGNTAFVVTPLGVVSGKNNG